MPASYSSWQYSYPSPLSAHLSTKRGCTASQIETPICTCRTTTYQFTWWQQQILWVDHWWNAELLENTTKLYAFIPDIGTHPPGMALPRTAWMWFNRLCTSVGRFCSRFYKWDITPKWLVSVAQKNRSLTMLFYTVQSIDLPMECMSWWF